MDIYFHLEHSFLKCLSTYSSFVNSTRNTHSEYCRTIWNSSKIMHRKKVKGKTVSIEVQSWHSIARCNVSVLNVLEMEQYVACHGPRCHACMARNIMGTMKSILQQASYANQNHIHSMDDSANPVSLKSRWLTELAISMKLLFYYFHVETWAHTEFVKGS
jgi:hypothetical protein